MRVMMKVSVPVEAGNEAIRSGTFGDVMGSVLKSINPEAVYCVADQGQRAALIFFDLQSPDQIPVVAEPLFQAFNAKIDLSPCMTLEEVQSGLAQLQSAT